MKKFLFPVCILVGFPILAKAQSQKMVQSKWVKIMANDSTANYFEAENEFRKYYGSYLKKRLKEKDEHETPGEAHLESPEELLTASYIKWSIAIKPFVRPDGSIMNMRQRLEIVNAEKKKQQPAQP